MALGAITKPSPSADFVNGNKRQRTRNVVLTAGANYTTGGETITPQAVGLRKRIDAVMNAGSARTTSGGAASLPIAVEFLANGSVKLQAYVAATGAEQAAAANLSTFSARLIFIGH